MSLKAKKKKIMEIIMSINDEQLMDDISNKVIPMIPINGNSHVNELVEKYKTKIEPDFDLEKIISEQNYNGYNLKKIDKMIAAIDIEEPLEDLLKMI